MIWKVVAPRPRDEGYRKGWEEKRNGIEEKRRDEAENARLCRETAVLGGDAVARAKVGSEGGVEVAAKTGGSGGGGTRPLS